MPIQFHRGSRRLRSHQLTTQVACKAAKSRHDFKHLIADSTPGMLLFLIISLLLSARAQNIKPHPNDYGPPDYTIPYDLFQNQRRRANACIVMLCRNSDLSDVVHSLQSFEAKFNARFGYPYIFINDKPFDETFISTVQAMLPENREMYFDLIPLQEWSYPSHINQTLAAIWRNELGKRKVMYSHLESYRFMCSWFSGHFFRNSRIKQYDWYWRVEPGVDFYCEVDYDPFLFMEANGKQYAFTVVLKELASTVSSLWSATLDYVRERKLNPPLLKYFRDDATLTYNLCHFWSKYVLRLWTNFLVLKLQERQYGIILNTSTTSTTWTNAVVSFTVHLFG